MDKSSKFWLNEALLTNSTCDTNRTSVDLLKMISVQRAISNFVRIVTGQNIKVRYGTSNRTDGKSVILSASVIKNKEFDAAVGLALHEGAHIKLSDFNCLKTLRSDIPQYIYEAAYLKYLAVSTNRSEIQESVINNIRLIFNWLEDRRIDHFMYTTSPGYRGYYKAMYDKFFNNPIIDTALQSRQKRKEDWDSYKFRLINITNSNRDLDALNGLREIVTLMDLNNINRFKTSAEVFPLVLQIYEIIELNIPVPTPQTEEEKEDEKKQPKPRLLGYTSNRLPAGVSLDRKSGLVCGVPFYVDSAKIIFTQHMIDEKGEYKKIHKKLILVK